jgi:hypothetical protein
MTKFWVFEDKPNKRVRIHRAECGTRKGAGASVRGKSVGRTLRQLHNALAAVLPIFATMFSVVSRGSFNAPAG